VGNFQAEKWAVFKRKKQLGRELVCFGDKAHAEQLGQGEGVDGVRLDFCIRDGFEILCMGKDS